MVTVSVARYASVIGWGHRAVVLDDPGLQSVHGRIALVRVGISTRRFYLNAYTW